MSASGDLPAIPVDERRDDEQRDKPARGRPVRERHGGGQYGDYEHGDHLDTGSRASPGRSARKLGGHFRTAITTAPGDVTRR